MLANDASLPWFTDFYWVIGVFGISLFLCHMLLIRKYPLSSINWKRVDYVWLSMACLGLVSSVGAGREIIMKNLVSAEVARLDDTRNHLQYAAQYEAAPLVCRKMHRNEATQTELEFRQYQEEFEAQCAWFKVVKLYLDTLIPQEPPQEFHYAKDYPSGGEQEAYKIYLEAQNLYNREVQSVQGLRRKSAMTPLETFAKFFGPVVLALALALRVTKVTADVEEEKRKRVSTGGG